MPLAISSPNPAITPATVTAFLVQFEAFAEEENFDLLQDAIDEAAVFRFNDGDFVGRDAIRAAFEKSWRGHPAIKKARFYLSDITVISTDAATATATYTYHWEGSQAGQPFAVKGRGTRVLRWHQGQFVILHEHLSRFPPNSP
jgi:ketosteroid isomerase-like protein